ncbi:hypothetical protein [Microbispora sp. CA-102843]|uniref:hypothetical protein n=1 Tax=Microbispora sp. CA-102843 TaxID=3239952 RepID=UPI003D8B43C0
MPVTVLRPAMFYDGFHDIGSRPVDGQLVLGLWLRPDVPLIAPPASAQQPIGQSQAVSPAPESFRFIPDRIHLLSGIGLDRSLCPIEVPFVVPEEGRERSR